MTEVKICGLTCVEDARSALACGADYLGFVLYAASPRGITADRLRQIADGLPAGTRLVAVFVNESPETVRAVAADCRLHAVQIHGDEPAGGFAAAEVPVWRAVRPRVTSPFPDPAEWPAARYVIDSAVRGQYGGTGVTADWELAARLAAQWPAMLAGGLTPGNVAEAIRVVRPLGVDASSGVERTPGRKDHRLVEQFVRRAKAAGNN
jgi:phosphoribosylanthranilate isomerase